MTHTTPVYATNMRQDDRRKRMLGEGAEEGLQTYMEAALRNVLFDEDYNLRDVSEEALYNSMLGAVTAFVTESPAVMQTYKDYSLSLAEPLSRYINSSDNLYKNAAKIKPISGFEDVVIHGDKHNFELRDKDDTPFHTWVPREFAEILRDDPNYHGGPIRLISCESGAEDFGSAQMLAELLNVEVMAPTDIVWVCTNGKIIIGPDAKKPTGTWRIFKPKGVINK